MAENPFGDGKPEFRIDVPEGSAKLVRIVVIVALLVLVAASSVYSVDPEEIGVVLRFGQFSPDRIGQPGLHFKLPLGIDRVIKVPVKRQLKQEFGFRSTGQGRDQRTQYRRVPEESNMLTGDLNAAEVEWVVQYRIGDAEKFLFRVKDVEDTFRDMTEAVVREVVGDRTVNEVLTVGRAEIASAVEVKLQELANQYSTGVIVDQVVLQDVKPPDRVKPSFNEVNEAQQQKEQTINQAQQDFNREVPRAEGEAQELIEQAEGYAIDRTNRAQGEAERFNALFAEYSKAPEVTRTRLYLETLSKVLPESGSKVVVDEDIRGLLPFLDLGAAAAARQAAAPQSRASQGGAQ
jgi:membrane protease subunit HflK